MINKSDVIKVLIERCYNKFPELMKEISKEEMSKILEENISIIVAGGTNKTFSGWYETDKRKIRIFNKENVTLEDIKKDLEILAVMAHEGIHALFRRNSFDTRNNKIFKSSKHKRFC